MIDQARTKDDFFPNFIYSAKSISAFSMYLGVFIISLKDGNIVRYEPKDSVRFREWLLRHSVRDMEGGTLNKS